MLYNIIQCALNLLFESVQQNFQFYRVDIGVYLELKVLCVLDTRLYSKCNSHFDIGVLSK
jgi:hypothetical protein